MFKRGVMVKPDHHYIVVLAEGVANQKYNYNYKLDRWQETTLHENEHEKRICRVVSRTGNIKAYFTRDDVHTLRYNNTKYNTLAELFITEQSPIIQTMHFVITQEQDHAYMHTTQSFCIDFIDKFKTKNINMIIDSTNQEKKLQDSLQQQITRQMYSTRELWKKISGHECQICLLNFKPTDKIYFCSLTGKHPFHAKCAIRWKQRLTSMNIVLNCPICRKDIGSWIEPDNEDFEKIANGQINTGKSMANAYTLSLFNTS